MKNRLIILILLLAMTLTGCSTYGQNNSSNADHLSQNSHTYLPVQKLWKGSSKPIQSVVNSIHSVRFLGGWVVAAVPDYGLIVSSPAQNNDPRYPDGLYILNTTSGEVTALLHVNAYKHEQINMAAANKKWLVYELGTDYGSQNKWSLFAYNWATKKSYKIYSVPNGFWGPDEPSGLQVEGDQCIWSNFIQCGTSNEIISDIHNYNLEAQKDDLLLRATTTQTSFSSASHELNQHDYQNGIICAASVGGGRVVYSLFDGSNPMDTSPAGDIYEIDLGTKQISHLLHLYHAANPVCSYGDQVVINTDYNPVPNSEENPAPYPVYLYTKGDKCIYQLSIDRNADIPTQNERYIAWSGGYAEVPQVYDLKTGTYYTIFGFHAKISGHYITWEVPQHGMLYWAQLPG